MYYVSFSYVDPYLSWIMQVRNLGKPSRNYVTVMRATIFLTNHVLQIDFLDTRGTVRGWCKSPLDFPGNNWNDPMNMLVLIFFALAMSKIICTTCVKIVVGLLDMSVQILWLLPQIFQHSQSWAWAPMLMFGCCCFCRSVCLFIFI